MDDALAQRLLGLFAEELAEHVSALNRDALALERSETDDEGAASLGALFRTTHTVKGAARAASVSVVEQVSHRLEDVLTRVRSGDLGRDPELFALIFETTDALADVADRIAAGLPLAESPLHAVLPRLAALGGGGVAVPATMDDPTLAAGTSGPALRVAAAKIDELLTRSAELVLAVRRLDALAEVMAASADTKVLAAFQTDRRAIAAAAHALDLVTWRVRTVPFHGGVAHLERAARDVAASGGKEVDLVIRGGDVEIDRSVLEALRDPLLHLVRNAVDHGVQSPELRVARGQSPRGAVTVSAAMRGGDIEIAVADDGAGVDLEAVRARLRERGMVEPADPRELLQSIFLPGFTTAREVTDVSGRGIGLDVVKQAVEAVRGSVEVSTGRGTRFRLLVPLTLSTLRVVVVAAGGQTYLIPISSVAVVARVGREDVRTVNGGDVFAFRGRAIPLVLLTALLGSKSGPQLATGKLPVVVLSHGAEVALVVDALIDERDVVVKGLGPLVRGSEVVSGASILANGRVALIVDVPEIVRRARKASGEVGALVAEKKGSRKRRILLVDDSITTRSLEKSILEAAGHTVITGVNGEDGWRLLQETPDIELVVSDVEMPFMDGFTLVATIRASPRFRLLPVILVTGRGADVDRARGLAAGASAYLAKTSFDQQLLLDTIERVS